MALALAACGKNGPEFSIVSGSENTVIEPIVQEFCAQHGATCSFKYEGSLDIGLALQSADGVEQDAVWPAASVWVDMFDTSRRVKQLTSIAQTPVILGVRRSKAEELGWVGKPVYMKDILAAVKDGKLKFLMTSATQSNSGASAYLAMLSSANSSQSVIEPGDLDNPTVQDTVKSLLAGVERSSGSSGWLADLYVDAASKGTLYDAMWNYEAVLKETNDRLKPLDQELLYAVYPADGVAVADSPLGFVDHGRGADVQTFFNDLLAYLHTAPIQQRIADTGRRIPLGGVTAKPEPDWNFDPTRLVTAIRTPEPAVIRQALDLYQAALRKPSLTALCLDFSGSMGGDGETQLQQAMQFLFTPERAAEVLVQWSLADRIIVIPFDGYVRDTLTTTGAEADQATLLSEVSSQSADGGTDMYACANEALKEIQKTPNLGSYLPAIVIMTDGRSEGDSAGFIAQWQGVTPHVPVFGITFGDAEKGQLDTLAAQTSARVFDGGADLAGAFRAARGYN
ncbi:substrate-binding domain-containing protein [Devosia sp. UYZn731]|uniref:substrate-binding domain-containing protein n=1 Tax=Devosia sp. UYZn731 TaxID=3156345 RepID=UPI0033956DFA